MRKGVLLIGLLAGTALAFAIAFTLMNSARTPAPSGVREGSTSSPDCPEAARPEEPVLNDRYLAQYARKKYGPLLGLLANTVPEGQRKRLGEILAEREIALAYAREKARRARQSTAAYLKAQSARSRERVAAELGPDVASRVDHYIQTLPQRLILGSLDQLLVYRDAGMTVGQMERLCSDLHDVEGALQSRPGTVAEMDAFIERRTSAYQAVLKRAAEFLAPKQTEGLAEELEFQVALLRMQRRGMQRPGDLPGPALPGETSRNETGK